VGLANLGSESETCVGSLVHLVGVSISFEKNFYRLPFTPLSLVRRIGPSTSSVHSNLSNFFSSLNNDRPFSLSLLMKRLFTVKFRQPSHEFTFGVGMTFISYPLVLTPLV
jgi:hypothetical protein